jgi:hypothetical protein
MMQLFRQPHLTVFDDRRRRGAADPATEAAHDCHSLSFVRRSSFGCRARGRHFELSAGGFCAGFPGDPFVCAHERHEQVDECLSFQFSAELAEEIGGDEAAWRRVAIPPVAPLAVSGSLARSVARRR